MTLSKSMLIILALFSGVLAGGNLIDNAIEHVAEELDGDDPNHSEFVSTSSSDNLFDLANKFVEPFFEGLYNQTMWKYLLSNSTRSGLHSDIEDALLSVKSDFCPTAGEACSNSPILGCKCRATFQAMAIEKCQDMPCDLWAHYYSKTAGYLKGVRNSGSVEDLTKVGVEALSFITGRMCECNPSIYSTMTSCVVKYNGGLLEKKYKKEYKQFMKKLNFNALTKVLSTMTKAYCKNDCNDDFDSQLIYLAQMLDNSLQPEGKGECTHFRHLSDTIMDLVSDISKYDFDTSPFDEDKFVNWLIVKSTALPKSFWCGREDCVDSLAENFNTCCSRNAISMVVNKKILKAGLKWFKSLIENLGEDMPNLTKMTQKKLLKAGDPVKMCRKYYKSDNSCSNATMVL